MNTQPGPRPKARGRSPIRYLRRLIGKPPPQRAAKARPPQSSAAWPDPWRKLIQWLEVDLVVDVGAGIGQYGTALRKMGYTGRIVSFEPLPSARAKVEARAAEDPAWSVLPYALGESDGSTILHVAGNSGSSSILDMLDRHREAAPVSAYVGEERVPVRRLDGVLDQVLGSASRPFLKLDVQGYELAVLRGAGDRLSTFPAVQLELSTVPLYAGAPLRGEVEAFLAAAGYVLAGVKQGFSDPNTGQMLQLDGIFLRQDIEPAGPAARP